MASTLNLDLRSSFIKERSKYWLTVDQINFSLSDDTLALVYLSQLSELQSILASAGEKSVEQYVAAMEMEKLTDDFWTAVAKVTKEREEKMKAERKTTEKDGEKDGEKEMVLRFKTGDAAKTWAGFRKMHPI